MRIYKDFQEAVNELGRELKEMGIKVHNSSRQDKYDDNPDYHTLELVNQQYTVIEPKFEDLKPVQPWAEEEWLERKMGILGHPTNPGTAISLRSDDEKDNHDWRDYLESNGIPVVNLREEYTFDQIAELNASGQQRFRFSYSYPERLNVSDQVLRVIQELKFHPLSRQLWVSVWDPNKDPERIGSRRVPCSLGYYVIHRDGKLHMNYVMRSCEFGTHFQNDCYLALKLLELISANTGIPMGQFTHTIFSFHVYERNVKDLF